LESFPDQLSASGSSNFGEQLSAALGQQLWRTTLGSTLLSSAGEQHWGAALGSSFEEQLCTASFEEPQLWGATLGSSFREPLWRIALRNRFEA